MEVFFIFSSYHFTHLSRTFHGSLLPPDHSRVLYSVPKTFSLVFFFIPCVKGPCTLTQHGHVLFP